MKFNTGLIAWAMVILPLAAQAQPRSDEAPPEQDVLMIADEVVYDEELGVVTARGSVEISRDGRVLRADTVSYNKRSDLVTASGNVALIDPNGETAFADYVELTGDLKSGAIEDLGILLTDGSRLAAAGGRRTADGRTDLRKAVYSPCELCEDDPDRAPIWQLKAFRVVHDKELQTIFYNDAFLEVFGLPVFYVPFFSHPDPTVKRKTGFLPPSFGRSSALGLTYAQPYYFNISPESDATLTPILTSDEGPVLAGEYRRATRRGFYQLEGSITRGDRLPEDARTTERTRGHVNLVGDFALNPYWDYGFAVERATDQTYLGRYGFGRGRTSLVQNVYLRGVRDQHYANVDALYFQNLDADVRESSVPFILPLVDYGYRGDPEFLGGLWTVDANGRVLERPDGADSQRLSMTLGWELPRVGEWGDVSTLRLSLRGDAYNVDNVVDVQNPNDPELSGFTGRIVPQMEYRVRWPFVRSSDGTRQIIEPIAQAILAPNPGNPKKIPNEDSLAFEFNDANLLSSNRFPGLDRVEGGARANYGIRTAYYSESGGWSEFMFGQTYRLQEDDTFEEGTGLATHFSDYVGRLQVSPKPYFDLGMRFRLDRSNFAIRRSSLSASAGPEWLRGSLTYNSLSDEPTTGVPSSEEQLFLAANYRFAENWRLSAQHQRDLGETGGSLLSGFGIGYEDECVTVDFSVNRNFTRDRDIEDTTNFSFQIRLRNLG